MQQARQQEIPSFVQLVPVERTTMCEQQQQHEMIWNYSITPYPYEAVTLGEMAAGHLKGGSELGIFFTIG